MTRPAIPNTAKAEPNTQCDGPQIIVQKFGGATLATPEKILQVASRISAQAKTGAQLVVAVSAMGSSTNQLIALANQVSSQPNRRELDMLLTTGERVSMALLSMALHDLDCPAISFTGSQAGILTDDSHVNAFIIDVKAHRVTEALASGKVVVLAGFQGVSPTSKEITTLGRGGTDTTAVAMAAFLKANRCEILKDVAGVFTADPKIVSNSHLIKILSYDQMLEMTFWGAKVLHYRSVELAKQKNVTVYIGPAAETSASGSLMTQESNVFESTKVLALNSHQQVLQLSVQASTQIEAFGLFEKFLDAHEVSFPQVLSTRSTNLSTEFFLTGPEECLKAIKTEISKTAELKLQSADWCTVTATCTGTTSEKIMLSLLQTLQNKNIQPQHIQISAMSISFFVKLSERELALKTLHSLI